MSEDPNGAGFRYSGSLSLACFLVGICAAIVFWANAPYPMETAGLVVVAIVLINAMALSGLALAVLGRARTALTLNGLLLAGFWIAALFSKM